MNLPPGSYTVTEVLKEGWQQTTPGGNGRHAVTMTSGQILQDMDFGNAKIAITGDLDGDGIVNTFDLAIVLEGWGQSGPGVDPFADAVPDGIINALDLAVVLNDWGRRNIVVTVDSIVTNDPTPPLSGTVDNPTAQVNVLLNGNRYIGVNQADGTWLLPNDTVTPPLGVGAYDVIIIAADLDNIGADETTNELIVDTIGPVVIVDPLEADQASPQLTGTVDDPFALLEVTVASAAYAATNKADGTWRLASGTISPPLSDGTYDVVIIAIDVAGARRPTRRSMS